MRHIGEYTCPVCEDSVKSLVPYPPKVQLKRMLKKFIKFPEDHSCESCAEKGQRFVDQKSELYAAYEEAGFDSLDILGDTMEAYR